MPKSNQKAAKNPEPIEKLVARSSLGASAWCTECDHPDLLHEEIGCIGQVSVPYGLRVCHCEKFVPMTVDEWLRRKGR